VAETGIGAATDVETPHGPARVHLRRPERPAALLLLGHGAGGGVETPDLLAASATAVDAGCAVGLVEQPYRVAGRRSPAPAKQLDAAWTAVVESLTPGNPTLPLIVGGRSLGARVACRTARETGASAVLCLAFPVHPPGKPERSRQDELDAVTVPTLVVQGTSDPFGMPEPGPNRRVVRVAGNHGLNADVDAVRAAVADWLPGVIPS